MRLILALLLLAQSATAGLPPTSVKASGDATPVTSFEFDFPNIPFTHTGVKASMNAIPNAALANSGTVVSGVTCTLGSSCSLISGSAIQKGDGAGGFANAVAGTDYQAAGNYITALTGDVTASGPGSVASTLATVNGSPGTTAISTVTTNGKGLVTANTAASTTGSGNVVLATSPTLVTPALGTPTALVGTNITGTAAGLTSGTVTTNANLTGVITSVGNATSTGAQTGTGNTFVMATAPTMTNPVVGTQATSDNSTKAASTAFVQTALAQLNPAAAVVAASTANIAGTYTNAVSGVCIGDTFQVTSTAAFAPDGVTLTVGQRFLMKDQTSTFQDGVWTLTTAANVGVLGALLTRALDFDSSADINAGQIIPVSGGTVNAGSSWYQTANVTTCNSDSQTWTQFQKASSAYASSTLTSAHLFVGNGSNVATDVAVSGDLTLANTGAFTIANVAVTNAKIANSTIDLTTKITGVLPTANVGAARTINAQTGTTYTFVLADGASQGGHPLVTSSNASAQTLTVPTNASVAFPVGDQIDVCQIGAGKATFAAAGGVTINSLSSNLSIGGQYVCVSAVKTATNTWVLIGNLIADMLRVLGLIQYA